MIYFISDCHFGHDREFAFGPRGFSNIDEMHKALIENWNKTVTDEDDIYVVGDFFLGTDWEFIKNTLNTLKGRIHLIIGNHDTPAKITEYTAWDNIVEIADALRVKYKKRTFFLCHYPTFTAGLEQDPHRAVINIFGHTHSKEKFFEDRPYMYNVAADAHNCTPVSIEQVIEDFNAKVDECIAYLNDEEDK